MTLLLQTPGWVREGSATSRPKPSHHFPPFRLVTSIPGYRQQPRQAGTGPVTKSTWLCAHLSTGLPLPLLVNLVAAIVHLVTNALESSRLCSSPPVSLVTNAVQPGNKRHRCVTYYLAPPPVEYMNRLQFIWLPSPMPVNLVTNTTHRLLKRHRWSNLATGDTNQVSSVPIRVNLAIWHKTNNLAKLSNFSNSSLL